MVSYQKVTCDIFSFLSPSMLTHAHTGGESPASPSIFLGLFPQKKKKKTQFTYRFLSTVIIICRDIFLFFFF
jgi:hypothetical protein